MDDTLKTLLVAATEAADLAYAPYSNYHVGAAVLTEKGIFTGTNVENACTNLGICAERVAISHARMHGATEISQIAICCRDASKIDGVVANPAETMPCGACRQWIHELAPHADIVTNGSDQVFKIGDLLPYGFQLPSH